MVQTWCTTQRSGKHISQETQDCIKSNLKAWLLLGKVSKINSDGELFLETWIDLIQNVKEIRLGVDPEFGIPGVVGQRISPTQFKIAGWQDVNLDKLKKLYGSQVWTERSNTTPYQYWFYQDLINLKVVDAVGNTLGRVAKLSFSGELVFLNIQRENSGQSLQLPFVSQQFQVQYQNQVPFKLVSKVSLKDLAELEQSS